MDGLAGAAFCEEKLEYTRSELQKAKEEDSTIITVGEHQKHYHYLIRKPNEPVVQYILIWLVRFPYWYNIVRDG